MKTEFVLWGQKADYTWQEDFLMETTDAEQIKQAKEKAEKNGYVKFRVMTYNGEAPDFIKAINI